MIILQQILVALCVACIWVIIIDWKQWIEIIKHWLFYKVYTKQTKYQHYRIKPIDCALCMSFWTTLILLLIFYPITHFTFLIPFLSSALSVAINKYF